MKGSKNKIEFKKIVDLLPNTIELYIEPFGGSFGLFKLLQNRVDFSIYNDADKDTYDKYKDIANKSYNKDYKEIINEFDSNNSLFYLDPPYFGKEHYYKHKFNYYEHLELYEEIKKLKGNFILSYNDCFFIRKLYKDYKIDKIESKSIYRQNEIIIYDEGKLHNLQQQKYGFSESKST